MEIGDGEGVEVEDGTIDYNLEPMDGHTQLDIQSQLSIKERMRLAKLRRAEQLKRWSQTDQEWKKQSSANDFDDNNGTYTNRATVKDSLTSAKRRRISFEPRVVLLEAVSRNDLDEVKALLEAGVSPDSTNEDGLTALHQCCIDDSEEMMKILVGFGGNPNATDTEKWTPLHAASTCGHLHLVKFLIDSGANLLSVNADGNMPYDLCEDETTLSYIENEMARRGVTQELIDDTRSQTERQMLNDLQLLQMDGGDLDSKDAISGASPLHIASANGYLSVVEFLLDHHVSTEVVDEDLWQPIHAASCWGHLEIVELLAQNGANISARTRNGETPFDICEDPEIKQRLIELKEQRLHLDQPRVKRSRSASTRTQSIRRTSLREKMNTTKRDVQDEKMYFMQNFDNEKKGSPSKAMKNDQLPMNGGTKSDIVDLKDVELTLLPSYLHEPTESEHQPNTSMVELLNSSKNSQVISSSNGTQNSISPPQRPPRLHCNQDAFGGNQNVSILSDSSPSRNSQITVRVSNNDSPASTEKISPDSKSRGSNLYSITQTSSPPNAAPNSASTAAQPQSQTLSDLKKQRSMSRVKQHSPSQPESSSSNNGKNQSTPNGPHSKAANISRGNDSIGGQSITVNSAVTFHSQNTDSPTTLLKTSSSRNSSKKNSTSRKSKAKAPTHPKSVAKNAHSSNSSSKHQHENTDNINVDPSTSNHRSPKKAGSRSSTNVKKYSAGTNEVVGPPQKKTGCCKIM